MNYEDLAQGLIEQVKRRGATQADLMIVDGESLEVQVRLGSVDQLQQARERSLGIRVFFGGRSAIASTSDFSRSSLEALLADVCAMAQATARDPYAGLPEGEPHAGDFPELALWDPRVEGLSVQECTEIARRAEAAALDYDARITNSEGSSFSRYSNQVIYASSTGFWGRYQTSGLSLSVVPVATLNGSMQRDYWSVTCRHLERMDPPESVGRTAAMRAVRRLGARKASTTRAPVVFEARVAGKLLSYLASAVSGYAVYKGASFLAGCLERAVSGEQISIYDDGRWAGGLGTRPFDGEGIPTRRTPVIEKGILRSYLLDTYSGKKLGMPSTGNAVRGVSDGPTVGVNNFYLEAGPWTPDQIVRSVSSGLYVSELMGFGVNVTTGDFSQGASGFWIEHGEIAYPVEEITIAGNLKAMLNEIEMVGNDLHMHSRVFCPTLKISQMTIAGI